jgi:hypothetical protein
MASENQEIRVVLFDVGGVLVEVSGVPTMLAGMGNRISPGRAMEDMAEFSAGKGI